MAAMCVNHPERVSAGTCGRCGRETCSLCRLDVDGRLFCSLFCFTEHALATKRKSLREQTEADPLSNIDFAETSNSAAALTEPSVVMTEEQADLLDESSILSSEVGHDDESQTSILDMKVLRASPGDDEDSESVIRSLRQDQTSLLGLNSLPDVLSQPPSNDTPLTFVLPGTRRATIQQTCVFHADTPAVVRCSLCLDPICTICVGDETQGGRCTPFCRRDDPARLRKRKLIAVAIATLLGAAMLLPLLNRSPKTEKPADVAVKLEPAKIVEPAPPPPPPAAPKVEPTPEPPKPEPPKVEVPIPVAPVLPKVEPKPEAPKPEPPKIPVLEAPLRPKPEQVKPTPPKLEPPKRVETAKVEPPKPPPPPPLEVELPKPPPPPAPAPKVEPPKPKMSRLDRTMMTASALIREATPLYEDLAGRLGTAELPTSEVRALDAAIELLTGKLGKVHELYGEILPEGPDPALLLQRRAILKELLASLKRASECLRVPRTIAEAEELTGQAMRLLEGSSSPAANVGGPALLREKLQHARACYASVREEAPDPQKIDERIELLDAVLESLKRN